nr:alpha/beta hydrolase [Lysinibacillus timonensis]
MGKVESNSKLTTDVIIEKTILASVLDNGFWDRWIVHGIEEKFINENKSKMINLEGWIKTLESKALEHYDTAKEYDIKSDTNMAEYHYRKAGIYYNLIQWVFPLPSGSRVEWYRRCLEQFYYADKVSKDEITYHTLAINNKDYEGRIRIPARQVYGVVLLITPTDCTKEEFYLYEKDFAEEGFVVVSFDGAGQGETLLINGHKADFESWNHFMKGIVEYTHNEFPNLNINLFGTSSGGAWAIEGSKHPLVSKIVTVSPPTKYTSAVKLPDYFKERISNMLVDFEVGHLPSFEEVSNINNILVFHGGKDLLISEEDLVNAYNQFKQEKRFITYEDEGHCCNYKLHEIRQRSAEWFKGVNINDV